MTPLERLTLHALANAGGHLTAEELARAANVSPAEAAETLWELTASGHAALTPMGWGITATGAEALAAPAPADCPLLGLGLAVLAWLLLVAALAPHSPDGAWWVAAWGVLALCGVVAVWGLWVLAGWLGVRA